MHPRAVLRLALLLALPLLAQGCTTPEDLSSEHEGGVSAVSSLELPADIARAEATIDAQELENHVALLSADDMGGRGPGNPGDRKARAYIAEQMATIGLEPGGDGGSWEQPFDIVSVTATVPETWTFRTEGGTGESTVELEEGRDFIAFSGKQQESVAIEDAELVFVGYGIIAPEYDWDDYKGTDLTGKILVLVNNDPDWDDALFEGNRRLYYGRWDYKYEGAAAQGAVGAIIIHTRPSAGYGWNVIQTSWTGQQVELPDQGEPRFEIGAWTTEDKTRELFAAAGFELDQLREQARKREFTPVPLGITTSLSLSNQIERTQTANVLGILPGSDPELADEYVVYSAHHDHIGNGGDPPDPIYNGALDNAAGVAQVLAIARAMKTLEAPPRRSILFNFVGAEESGLLGSEYWASHPTVQPGKVAANINYDGGNIWGKTRDVTYIGFGKSSLDDVVVAGAAAQGREVRGDQFPDRGFFYRSDQFNFARVGIPAIYLDTGTDFVDRPEGWGKEQIEAWESDHYHQPSDEYNETWVFDGMIEDTILGLRAGLHIANSSALPTWNSGDEFEQARTAALAEAAKE